MKAPHLEIVDIPVHHIEADPDNVNEMSPEVYRALREELRLRGNVQPVLVRRVRPAEETPEVVYRIIDGEHRWRAVGELGAETIPCVVAVADDLDAKVRSLTMNIHGTFVPIRLAHFLADLTRRVPPEEVAGRMAIDRSEMDDLLGLADYLGPDDPDRDPPEPAQRQPGVEVAVVATHDQAEKIRKLLHGLTGGDPEKNSAVVARRAREYVA